MLIGSQDLFDHLHDNARGTFSGKASRPKFIPRDANDIALDIEFTSKGRKSDRDRNMISTLKQHGKITIFFVCQ
jgi:hypothetical protein